MYAIALHGGAGAIARDVEPELRDEYYRSLGSILDQGLALLARGEASLDVVESVVRLLEDDPLFNAGRGAVLNSEGQVELEASIMEGRDRGCGAVVGLRTVRHPVTLARRIMEAGACIALYGEGAERFAGECGVERVDPSWFVTDRRRADLERVRTLNGPGRMTTRGQGGTVGCVARDVRGDLAAATSTGGRTNKLPGRMGDTPILGAGNFACNRSIAASGTGIGEEFLRHAITRDLAALVEYRGLSVAQAADEVVHRRLRPGEGGVVAVDPAGTVALAYNSPGMYRAAGDARGMWRVAIWDEEVTRAPGAP